MKNTKKDFTSNPPKKRGFKREGSKEKRFFIKTPQKNKGFKKRNLSIRSPLKQRVQKKRI
ncbi:hypothetical protein EC507_03870 [Helicobacter pylori]|nr:hypothetical protein EC507_03870 [Helicobacter pylori]